MVKLKMSFKWGFIIFVLILIFLVLSGYIYPLLELPLKVNSPSLKEIKKVNYSHIVVLSGGCKRYNILGTSTEKRLESAIELYKPNTKIILAGNFVCGKNRRTGRNFLIKKGIPPKNIVELDYSNSTINDCKKAAEFLIKHRIEKPIIITSFYHAKRVQLIFSYFYKKKFFLYSSSTFREKFDNLKKRRRLLKLLIHEYGGIFYWYFKRGFYLK